MGILESVYDSVGGVFADQWKDVVTVEPFTEHTVVAPGVRKNSQNDRGNNRGSDDVLSTGSIILVPENTAAVVFNRSGIECVFPEPGGYEYRGGEASIFDARRSLEHNVNSLIDQIGSRFGFSGMSSEENRIVFVNLREIRGLKFGTRGPLVYYDKFYGTDLEVFAYGTFSVQVTDATRFLRMFVPANETSYSFDDSRARDQLVAELLNSFTAAVNALSETCRISHLPSRAGEIIATIANGTSNASTWDGRFGLRLGTIAIENIEFSDDSRELVRGYAERRMNVAAYEGVSRHAADIAAQQTIAEGVRENGFGDGGGMLFGMNLATSLNARNASAAVPGTAAAVPGAMPGGVPVAPVAPVAPADGADAADGSAARATSTVPVAPVAPAAPEMSLDDRIEALKKLKELVDIGILTQEEFDAKKRQMLKL